MEPGTPLFFHAASKATHTAQTMRHRQAADAAQKAEYWRKLYVAMTRAEDELYITGYLSKARDGAGSWYEAIEAALRPEAQVVRDADGAETALVYPLALAAATAPAEARRPPVPMEPLLLPELPPYRLRRIVRPSSLGGTDVERVLETAAETALAVPRDPQAARREGVVLHALLQHLSRLAPDDRPAVAERALAVLLPEAPERHEALAGKALSILGRPELAGLFGASSRAELPILAQGHENGRPISIAGRIDRLVVEPGRVLVVDYKSDAVAPASEAAVPAAYRQQLGLYALVAGQLFPGHEVRGAILWTGPESLMNLAPEGLAEAVAGFTIG
jgi:ATP-dependent helicase/nuclease subunit A